MQELFPWPIQKLIEMITQFPGIWEKTATKIALFLLTSPQEYKKEFQTILNNMHVHIRTCPLCNAFMEHTKQYCSICSNAKRKKNTVCIVETYEDMVTIEKLGWYDGTYFLLWGVVSPLKSNTVQKDTIEKLLLRIQWIQEYQKNESIECILATNPNIEWEATALYLKEILAKQNFQNIRVTRLSRGISGWYLEHTDSISLLHSLKERKEFA